MQHSLLIIIAIMKMISMDGVLLRGIIYDDDCNTFYEKPGDKNDEDSNKEDEKNNEMCFGATSPGVRHPVRPLERPSNHHFFTCSPIMSIGWCVVMIPKKLRHPLVQNRNVHQCL